MSELSSSQSKNTPVAASLAACGTVTTVADVSQPLLPLAWYGAIALSVAFVFVFMVIYLRDVPLVRTIFRSAGEHNLRTARWFLFLCALSLTVTTGVQKITEGGDEYGALRASAPTAEEFYAALMKVVKNTEKMADTTTEIAVDTEEIKSDTAVIRETLLSSETLLAAVENSDVDTIERFGAENKRVAPEAYAEIIRSGKVKPRIAEAIKKAGLVEAKLLCDLDADFMWGEKSFNEFATVFDFSKAAMSALSVHCGADVLISGLRKTASELNGRLDNIEGGFSELDTIAKACSVEIGQPKNYPQIVFQSAAIRVPGMSATEGRPLIGFYVDGEFFDFKTPGLEDKLLYEGKPVEMRDYKKLEVGVPKDWYAFHDAWDALFNQGSNVFYVSKDEILEMAYAGCYRLSEEGSTFRTYDAEEERAKIYGRMETLEKNISVAAELANP